MACTCSTELVNVLFQPDTFTGVLAALNIGKCPQTKPTKNKEFGGSKTMICNSNQKFPIPNTNYLLCGFSSSEQKLVKW